MTARANSTERGPVATLRAPRSIDVHRKQGTVVVTVHGVLDHAGATVLERILTDLIDGQGNRSLVLDLANVDPRDPFSLYGLRSVAERARLRGAAFVVEGPAAHRRN